MKTNFFIKISANNYEEGKEFFEKVKALFPNREVCLSEEQEEEPDIASKNQTFQD